MSRVWSMGIHAGMRKGKRNKGLRLSSPKYLANNTSLPRPPFFDSRKSQKGEGENDAEPVLLTNKNRAAGAPLM